MRRDTVMDRRGRLCLMLSVSDNERNPFQGDSLRTSQEAGSLRSRMDEATASTHTVEVTSTNVTWAGEDNQDPAVSCCAEGGDARKEAVHGARRSCYRSFTISTSSEIRILGIV